MVTLTQSMFIPTIISLVLVLSLDEIIDYRL